jgi:hypothetical protein
MATRIASRSLDSEQSDSPLDDYLETISLLQEEVARLEQELQAHDEGQRDWAASHEGAVADQADAPSGAEDQSSDAALLERFKAELAGRDETIGLLLEEVSRAEAAQAATLAEWEHLAEWVAALEHRVEGQDAGALRELENRLAAQEQKAEAAQAKSDQDRRAWEAHRQIYQAEIARLQGTLDAAASSRAALGDKDGRAPQDSGSRPSAVDALQAENLRLRAAWDELAERATAAAERAQSADVKLAEALHERTQLRHQLEQIEDERSRERLESEATVAELHSQLSQVSLAKPPEPPTQQKPEAISSELDIELRVRAMRCHFQEIHEREKEERRQKQLITRLSRLWSRTGPR